MRKRRYPPQRRLERVSVRAERRNEPDWDRFAWALLQYVRLKQTGVVTKSPPLHPNPDNDIVNLTTPKKKGASFADNHSQ
jgi:hypothetical protein